MEYYDEENVIHVIAKEMLELFEKIWLDFLPKVEREVKLTSKHLFYYFIYFYGHEELPNLRQR
jgi:hypothetical protein